MFLLNGVESIVGYTHSSKYELFGRDTFCHQAASLTTFSVTHNRLPGGESCRKKCSNANDMLYLILWATWSLTFSIMLFLFPLSVSSPASLGMPVLTTSIWFSSNLFYCFDLALAMNYPCMLRKMSLECAVWNNNAVHNVQAELFVSSRCLARVGCCLWSLHWKIPRHTFVLFFVLRRNVSLFYV